MSAAAAAGPPAPSGPRATEATRTLLALLVAGFAMLAFGTDLLIASLPSIQRHFGVSMGDAQLTLSLFVVVFAFAQLIYGPLSDRFGRRPALIIGWALFTLGSAICAAANSLAVLLIGRVVQALGCCALTVVGRAAVRDLFGVEGTAKMLGLLLSVAAIPIVLSPMLGGTIEQAFGWRANFALLLVVASIALVLMVGRFDETHHQRDRHATHLGRLFANYRVLLADRRFVGYALCIMFNYGAIMAFLSGSAFALVASGQMTPRAFGVAFGMCICGFAIMSLVVARNVQRVGIARLVGIGAAIAALAGTIMAGLALAEVRTVAAVMIPYFLFMLGNGLVSPSAAAGAVLPFPKMAGTASSFLGFLQLSAGALVGAIVGRIHDGTVLPMTLVLALCTWGIALSFLLVVRGARRAH